MCLVFAFALTRNKDKGEEIYDITVHIKGEVVNPGVYTLKSTCRMNELIETAGGFTDSADIETVNLAERIVDGEVIYIGRKVDTTNPNLININTADANTLDKLEGVGPSMAQRIIDYRNKYGNFRKTEHLMNVDGIGEKQFEKIKEKITV